MKCYYQHERLKIYSAFSKKTKRYFITVLVSLVNYWEKKERENHALFCAINPSVLKGFQKFHGKIWQCKLNYKILIINYLKQFLFFCKILLSLNTLLKTC